MDANGWMIDSYSMVNVWSFVVLEVEETKLMIGEGKDIEKIEVQG